MKELHIIKSYVGILVPQFKLRENSNPHKSTISETMKLLLQNQYDTKLSCYKSVSKQP